MRILEVLNIFRLNCSSCKVEPIGYGSINDLFLVVNADIRKQDYLIQRVDNKILDEGNILFENISLVTQHFQSKTESKSFDVLNPILTKEGLSYYKDKDSFYWRIFDIGKRIERQKVNENSERAYEYAIAFGKFLSFLDYLPTSSHGTLMTINQIEQYRLKVSKLVISRSLKSINLECENEFDYVLRLREQILIIENLLGQHKPVYSFARIDKNIGNSQLDRVEKKRMIS